MGRLRNKPWASKYLFESKVVVNNPRDFKGKWNKKIFDNNLPIRVDIGMGKGSFIEEHSKNKNFNYLGIEKFPSIQVYGVKKKEIKIENDKNFNNLYFISKDVIDINDWFLNEINIIFLNFSDPWPKERHAKRRLTHKLFLKKYYKALERNGSIEIKTDQKKLYEFSIQQIKKFGKFKIVDKTEDLHKNNDSIITTEYERKFTKLGHPIYFVKLVK